VAGLALGFDRGSAGVSADHRRQDTEEREGVERERRERGRERQSCGSTRRSGEYTSPVRASERAERAERARLYVWAKYGSSVCCVWARTSKGQGPLPSTGCPSERSHTFSFTGIDSLQRRQKAKSLLLSLSFQILAPLPLISNRFVHLMGKANSSFLHGTSNSLDRMVGWFWRGAALHTTPSQLKNSQVRQQNNTESAQNASRISRGLNPRRNRHEQDE